jgi:hypothetical protein
LKLKQITKASSNSSVQRHTRPAYCAATSKSRGCWTPV